MEKVFAAKIPVKSWTGDIEQSAFKQAMNLATLPFAFKHIALMPDCHAGYGMPIGGVLATNKVIIPNAVGVDIGCGMCALKLPWKIGDIPNKSRKKTFLKIVQEIKKVIPVGFERHEIFSKDIEQFCRNMLLDYYEIV